MIKHSYRILGITGIIVSIILVIYYSAIMEALIAFIEEHISSDHQMEPEGIANIKKLLSIFILLFLAVGVLILSNGVKKAAVLIRCLIDVQKAKKFFLTNDLTTRKNLQKRLFIVGTTIGVLVPFFLPLINQPSSEGWIEEGSSVLFLVAGIILLISTGHLPKIDSTRSLRNKIRIPLILISLAFIIMFGEEISWGQRIFGWEAEGIFKEFNVQQETNIHNFFNPLFDIFYPVFGLSLFIGLSLVWFFPRKDLSYVAKLLLPHPGTFFLVFMMACLSYEGHSEIFEELLAVFCVIYSLRVFNSLKFPAVKPTGS